MRRLAAFAAAASVMAATPGYAEKLVSSLSTHQVMITSSFTGTELVLFGSVERDAATVPRRGGYDLVVTVIGPRQTLVTRKKERIFGIWTNAASRTFVEAPTYLAVLSNRALDQITSRENAQKLAIGIPNFPILQRAGMRAVPSLPDDTFRNALVRLRAAHGLYREEANAVTFLTPNLFRASIQIPAEAPLGTYEVDIKLFADGANLAQTTSALEIVKAGVEQYVANAARDHALLYGLITTLMALVTGWLASVIFRRD
ncbi:MAG TPA: TIGR02186 family protein [Pseudorhodoplanes sp.]|jgi:uncharacterized protein (TIGR02186 family)|nr:TIGR02186 family protein [Pseudorhodoplanes sp.]